MILSDRYSDALAFAAHLHRRQMRKGTNIPYLAHLLTVSSLVIEAGGTEDQAIAGLLHDAPEDQGGRETLEEIRWRFGDNVAGIVEDCTDAWTDPKPPWRERKEAYLAHLPSASRQSLLVSLADKVHNADSILADYRQIGDDLWSRFNAGRNGTIWYYRSLSEMFQRTIPSPLADELARIVNEFPELEVARQG